MTAVPERPRSNPIPDLARDAAGTANTLAAAPSIAGVSVAGIVDGKLTIGAAGVADAETGAPVTWETRFRPGSITKLVTATVVMQCVDDGLLSLDDKVSDYVRNLRLADTALQNQILIRHLLSHSSGIDAGDKFQDTGDADDASERYIDELAGTGFLFPPGTTFSYCNAGTVLAGHIAARVRGETWEDVVRHRVLEALSMTNADFVPADGTEPGRDARGHVVTPLGLKPAPSPVGNPMTARALGPAGATLIATAAELALFASDLPVMAQSKRAMEELHAPAPGGVVNMLGGGLGWMVWRNGVRIGGAYPGMSGLLARDPDSGAAIAILTNSDQGINSIQGLLDPGAPPADDSFAGSVDLSKYEGVYRSHAGPIEVRFAGEGLVATALGGTMPITPLDGQTFASPLGPIAFAHFDDDGVPAVLRVRMRVWARDPLAVGQA